MKTLCIFYKRYECFETFQEVLSHFAIYGECNTTIVKHKEPTMTFFSEQKSAESSNISYNALTIYIKATYHVLASFKTPVLLSCKNYKKFDLITMDTVAHRNEDCLTVTRRVAHPY